MLEAWIKIQAIGAFGFLTSAVVFAAGNGQKPDQNTQNSQALPRKESLRQRHPQTHPPYS